MRKILISITAIFCFTISGFSQSISEIKLNSLLCCNLHDVLMEISMKHNVKFLYDVEKISTIEINVRPVEKPLDTFLDQVCKSNKLNYYINNQGFVVITDSREIPVQKRPIETKTYKGGPEKTNFTLSGRVVDRKTQESLPFVNIVVKGTTLGTTSNIDGFFTLLKVPTDTSTLTISYIGYQNRDVFLTPTVESNNLTVEMETEILSIDEATVVAEKQDILQVSGSQTSMIKMSPVKLNTLPNLGEKDILRSFQLMPGISAANENSSGLYVRGGTPDQVLVLYDGFTVYNVEHMFGFFSAFNSNAIKDVQLYKGGFDTKYGGRLASVVEITGKEGNKKTFNAAADVSMMSVNGFVEFPVGNKTSAVIAGRRSWKSPIYDKIFEQFTDENTSLMEGIRGGPGGGRFGGGMAEQETKSYFYDLNGKITFSPTDKDVIALSFYNGKDDLDNSVSPNFGGGFGRFGGGNINGSLETIDLTNWGNTGASLKWSRQFNSRLYVNSLVSFSNYFSLRERSTSGSFMRGGEENSNPISRGINEDNNLIDITGKTDIEYQATENQQFEFGIQYTYNDIDYGFYQNDTISVVERSTQGNVYSAYFQDRISLLNTRLTITPGLRYNYFSGTQKNYFEPRFNFMYNVTDKLKLKGAAGNYYQFAKRVIREDITEGSRDFWVLSDNDKLPVSSSWQLIFGAAYETPKYLFDVEGFYKDLNNVTEYSLRIEPQRGSLDYSENFFTGTGIAKGIDFLAQKKYGKFTGWLGYTIAQVTNNIEEFGDYDFYAAHDVTHEFKSVLTFKWHKWDFALTWIYASGRPYTAPEGGYQLSLLDGTYADYINVSVKNGNRLPAYHRLDLSARYNFRFGLTSPASIGFSLFNAYDRANVWYKEYEIIDNDILETPVYYLGMTPNINITIKLK